MNNQDGTPRNLFPFSVGFRALIVITALGVVPGLYLAG